MDSRFIVGIVGRKYVHIYIQYVIYILSVVIMCC